ncbi:hypothetical protein L798_06760 [Zootermopsis nevadensis]|uniref:Uncharacterized protein n=2 Tax=Zootermopsis nevadensis TaxID=136037 RepID=A0A067RMN7_ZOONE|nr:hypothetical protein L798_06760 [Zootermopsis nevadensis]
MLLVPAWLFIAKQLQSEKWKRSVISVILIVNIALHLCLTFIPLSNILKDVTHCHRHSSSPLMEELVTPHHDKQWDHFKPILQVPSHSVNITTKKSTLTKEVTTENLSLPPTDGHTPRATYHDTAKQVIDNSNTTTNSHSIVLPISSTKQNNVFLDISTEMPKNMTFFSNVKVISSSTTEPALLSVIISNVSLVTAVKNKLSVLINNQSRPENNKNTFTSTGNERELIQNPIFKEINYSNAHKPTVMNIPVHGESNDMVNFENYSQTLIPQYETGQTDNNIKAMFTLLNRTLSKVYSNHNKKQLHKKLHYETDNSNEEQDDSTGHVPSSESENATGLISTNYKIWQKKSHKSWSEPQNAHLKQKIKYFSQESEDRYVPVISERGNTDDTMFHKTLLPKHPVIPSIQHKYVNRYYVHGKDFRNISQTIPDYSRTVNLEDISNDEHPTNRLQSDIVIRMKGSTESPPDSENQIKPAGVRLWGDYKNVQLLRQYKSGIKMEQAGKKENSLPIRREEVKELSAIRNVQKNMKQEKEFLLHDRQLGRKRVSKSVTSESQEAQQSSTNTLKKFTRKHSAHHTMKHCDKRSTKYKRHETSQFSPYAKAPNYRGTNKPIPKLGTIRRPMVTDSSKPKYYDNNTDLGVDKVIMQWSNKSISMQLWNITTNKLYDTTFSTILLISVLAGVFSKAVTATSSQFFQREDTVKVSEQKPITSQNCHQQVRILLSWGLFGCPLLAALVLATECSFQPRVFLLFSASLFMLTLLVTLFLLQLPGKNWDWKQSYENEGKQSHSLSLQRFGYYISIFFTGFVMACNSEFILWHIETLHGFPYNYQLLYCSYVAFGTLVQALVRSWLQQRQLHVLVNVQDSTNLGNHNAGSAAVDGLWSIGTILLGLHFLAASLLHPAWTLVSLGILQGCSAALLFTTTTSGWWAVGYGLGSLVGGFVVQAHGADWLFWMMACSIFVWSTMVTLCRG